MSGNFKLRVADDSKASSESNKTEKQQDPVSAVKPSKPLPTARISFAKQLDILRAFGASSGPTSKVVAGKDVAEIVHMSPSTLTLGNPFFVDCKFLLRTEGVGMTPAAELLDYAHAYEWNKDTAAHKLSPLLSKMWFWEALQPRLNFQELTDEQAVTLLSEKCSALPEYKSQLRMILEFLEAAGMIKRENGQVRIIRGGQQQHTSPAQATAPPDEKAVTAQSGEKNSPLPRSSVSTNFAQSKLGVVQFDISVRVEMSEFAGWQPARISAFFNGIAQVLSAKGTVEQESGRE